jgi:hypothetical protein
VSIKIFREEIRKAFMINNFIMSEIIDAIMVCFNGKLLKMLINPA